jgi:predicted DNA-binding transcriptional regulator YafY
MRPVRRADRLFRIVQLLRRDRITTARRLARELHVAERTIYRDVADLSRLGVPVEGEAGVGYRLPRGFDLPPLMFTADELEALSAGARIVRAWGDPDLADAAASALLKVENVLPPALAGRIRGLGLFAPDFHVPKEAARALADVRRALRESRKTRVDYVTAAGARSSRTLRPLGVFFWGTAWSLAAWCELRNGFRNFRLDRIERIEVLAETFAPEPGRTLDDFLETYAGGPELS